MTLAYGIDLAGYSTGKTGVAYAKRVHRTAIEVTVIKKHIFSNKHTSDAALADITRDQQAVLRSWADGGMVVVDVPIEVGRLPIVHDPQYVWELTKRPVDYAFNAMPPLADRIGAPVARFQHLIAGLPRDWIGTKLFETYPAESLRLMGRYEKGYKNQSAEFSDGKWREGALANILNGMEIRAKEGAQINDDEFDAMLCALVGVALDDERLDGDALNQTVNARIRQAVSTMPDTPYTTPKSYVLLRTRPKAQITLSVQASDSGLLF